MCLVCVRACAGTRVTYFNLCKNDELVGWGWGERTQLEGSRLLSVVIKAERKMVSESLTIEDV